MLAKQSASWLHFYKDAALVIQSLKGRATACFQAADTVVAEQWQPVKLEIQVCTSPVPSPVPSPAPSPCTVPYIIAPQ